MIVGIVGGGIAGIISAIICLQQGFDIVIFEKQAVFGGSWINFATEDAHLQTEPQFYNQYYRMLSQSPNGLNNLHSTERSHVVYIMQTLAEEYNLKSFTKFNTEVLDIKQNLNDEYVIQTAKETHHVNLLIRCCGYLSIPRKINLSGFSKPIQYAHSLNPNRLYSRDVLIIGWGPYALQSMITCKKYGANHVTMMGRRTRWVWPRSYFVTLITIHKMLPSLLSTIIIIAFLLLYYTLSGLYEFIPTDWSADFNYLPSINDQFFELHRDPSITYAIDEIQSIENSTVKTKGGRIMNPDVIILATGFEQQEFEFMKNTKCNPKTCLTVGIPHRFFQPVDFIRKIRKFCEGLRR